jgi:hypothetical protein
LPGVQFLLRQDVIKLFLIFSVKPVFAMVHAYCLAYNQYHLLLKTPKGNLSRVMWHFNGVYTQRYPAAFFKVLVA